MSIADIDPVAVVGATLASFFLGFVWYSLLFSKPWMTALGLKREDVDDSGISSTKALLASVFASFLTVMGLAILYAIQPGTLGSNLMIAGLVWGAFSLTPMLKMLFWEDRPMTLFAIDGGYELLSVMVAGVILSTWS